VILTGVLIYEMVMEEFGFKQLRVSTPACASRR